MIGGSSDVDQDSMGAFQEFPQVCTCVSAQHSQNVI